MTTNQYSRLFRLASKFIRYFFLLLFGVSIAYVMSTILGVSHISTMLLPFVIDGLLKIGIILLCLIAVVVILESLR